MSDLMNRWRHVGIRAPGRLFERARRESRWQEPEDPGRVTCFCEFCQKRAKAAGINPDRAKQGYLELEKFVRAGRGGQRPVDGYYVTLWRLMLRYPELLAWEMLWTDSLRDTYKAIYKTAKQPIATSGSGGTSGTTTPSTQSIGPSRICKPSRPCLTF